MAFFCLEQAIGDNNDVRLIDAFVGKLPLNDFGFKTDFIDNGRPAYHPCDLLKLFLYGYMNRIRSSRVLEKECKRNLEVMWLMKGLSPDHNTISNFRKDNPKAIRRVFQATVKLARNFALIGGQLLAGDGTRMRAQNSKKNNFNEKKIERHLDHIESKLEQYNAQLAAADGDKMPDEDKQALEKKISQQKVRKAKYETFKKQLVHTGEKQISTSDTESRQMITRNNITEVCYNIQSTVDAKHNIPIDYKVTNQNDSKAMGNMVRRAKTILETKDFTMIFDKGYHTGSELKYVEQQDVEVIVAIPAVASHAPNTNYDIEHFIYDQDKDSYTCPQNEILKSNGKWYHKNRKASKTRVKHYKTNVCLGCPAMALCTNNKKGRLIERSEYTEYIAANKERMDKNKAVYRRRQAIVEHPFGIMKRQWGFDHIMTKKTINRAAADIGLVFCAYNLRRIFNILDKDTIKAYLEVFISFFIAFKRFLAAKYAVSKKLLFSTSASHFLYKSRLKHLEMPIFGYF